MSRRRTLLVVVACALLAALPRAAVAQLTLADREALLDLHNAERCAVDPPAASMPALVWNPLLASVAQSHAQGCVFQHNASRSSQYQALGGAGYVGENIAWGTASFYGPLVLAQLWAEEGEDWSYGPVTNANVGQVGHYTQMVWASSTSVGCGAALCGGTRFVVCNYAPGGNYLNQAPYAVGSGPNQACAAGNGAPVADAGPDQTVAAGSTVVLDGSGCDDPDGDDLGYAWRQLSGPAVTLSATTVMQPSFGAAPALSGETLRFELVVDDGIAESAPDSVSIHVVPEPANASGVVLASLMGLAARLRLATRESSSSASFARWRFISARRAQPPGTRSKVGTPSGM